MAGVVNAFKNITSDPLWIIKIAVFSIPLYLFFSNKAMVLSFFTHEYIFYLALAFFYLGIASVLIHRNIQNKTPILPFLLDIFVIVKNIIGSVISIIPSIIIICFLFYFMDTMLNIKEEYVFNIIKICVCVLMFPFICIPVVVYSANYKITDVIKSARMYFDTGGFVEHFLMFLIQSIVIFGTVLFILYMCVKQYLGAYSIYVNMFYAFSITLYILIVFSWASDLYGDVIPEIEIKKKSKF